MHPNARRAVITLMVTAGLLAGCDLFDGGSSSVNRSDRIAEASFSFEIEAEDRSSFRIEAVNGSIDLSGSANRNTVSIRGVRQVGSESIEDAEANLRELVVQVTESTREIRVETVQPEDTRGRQFIVDYEIMLPDHWSTLISQVNGTVIIGAMREDVVGELVNGDMQLDDIIANAVVSVVNGTIDSEIALPSGGTLEHSVVNGGIDLAIPDTTSAAFSAQVVNGTISLSDLDLSESAVTERSVTGTLRDGNGTITVRVTNGDIEVTGTE